VPDDGSYEQKRVALCDKALNWCWTAYFYLFVCLWVAVIFVRRTTVCGLYMLWTMPRDTHT